MSEPQTPAPNEEQIVASPPIEIDIDDPKQVANWSSELGVQPEELVAAAKACGARSVQAIGEQLAKRSASGPAS